MRSDTINQTKLKKKSHFRNELDAWILFIPSVIVLSYLWVCRICTVKAQTEGFKGCVCACGMDDDDARADENGAELHNNASLSVCV